MEEAYSQDLKHKISTTFLQFLEERMDPDFGLLDKLFNEGVLSRKEIDEVKAQPIYRMRNLKIIEYISLEPRNARKFITALRDASQSHLANYLTTNGGNEATFNGDWPLTDREIAILDFNRGILVDSIDLCDLLLMLFSCDVINKRQLEFISSKPANYEKNEALLDILRRRNQKDYWATVKCLVDSNQIRIAEVLDEGGVIVGLHATLVGENIDEAEEQIATNIANQVRNRSLAESNRILELAHIKIIAAKRGQSIVLYVLCKTLEDLTSLCKRQSIGELNVVLKALFNRILSRPNIIRVESTISTEDLQKADIFFKGCINLRAACDFNPENLSNVQKNELKDILQSTKISLKIKESKIADEAFSVYRRQKEFKIVDEEEDSEGEVKDDDSSEDDQWIREKDRQTLKRKAQIIEYEDIMEAAQELEATPSMSFQREHKRAKFADFLRDTEKDESEAPPSQKETSMIELEILESGSEDSKTESEYADSPKTEGISSELLNLKTSALNFKKGDLMETIPPTDFRDAINWWKVRHIESGEIGYILRNHIVIDFEFTMNQGYKTLAENNQAAYLKEVSSASMSNLPYELLDSILLKSYLECVLREKQVQKNKDYDAISQLASVDCCWFQRIRRRKFKKELWRSLVVFYKRKEKIYSIYRINRQYLEENIQLKGLDNRLKSNDCLTDVQTASLYRQNLSFGKKNIFKRFRDPMFEVMKQNEATHSVFRRSLCDTKQHLIAEVIENGGAMVKVEIKFQTVQAQHQNLQIALQIAQTINELRDKRKARSHQIEKLMGKLKQDDLEIFSAGQYGDVIIVWIWCKTKHAVEKLQTLNKSKNLIHVFTELVKNLSFSSEKRIPARIQPKVNIDFEQFEKTLVFFSIAANLTSKFNLRRRTKHVQVLGVTKLRNKIHVLLCHVSDSGCEILVFEDQIPLRLQKRIKIKEIEIDSTEGDPADIASNEMENFLYVLDFGCIWKIKEEQEKKEKIIRWLELRNYYEHGPRTLSVTTNGQLLLVGRREFDPFFSLMIFGEGGSEKADLCLYIPLPEYILDPYHAVETSKGNYIISHEIKDAKSGSDQGMRQMEENLLEEKMEEWMKVISEVSGDGKTILRRFIPKNEEQMLSDYHCHLAVDYFGRVFLADKENDRVILLDSDLYWNGILIPTEHGKEGKKIRKPRRLSYCEEKKELIVGTEKEIFVYTLNRK